MALYEIVLRQRYFDQLLINTFDYYVAPGLGNTPNALELLTLAGFIPEGDPLAFPEETLAWWLTQVQSTSLDYLSVEARELYSLTDFYEAAYSPVLSGAASGGDAGTPVLAFGLYTARVRLDIRRGFKRLGGVSEGQVNAGGVVASAVLTVLDGVAEAMSAELIGVTAEYVPCVISRLKVIDEETDKVTYQLYPTEEEQEEHIAQPLVWTPYTQIRTQVSRQYGRGQ